MNIKAIALFSGGLDSILAAKIIMKQKIDVQGISFYMPFHIETKTEFHKSMREKALQIGLPLEIISIEKEYLDVIKNPKFGYGKNMNPCVDCRIFFLAIAKKYMKSIGASFIITGEILGQRPMSQRRDTLDIVERESELRGYLLRPLCAKHLRPTIPELENWVNREELLNISGRSRKIQLQLAKEFGITNYSTPGGGCLLTDKNYVLRLEDLSNHNELTLNNINLLRFGRQFRSDKGIKIIVGHNEKDNDMLEELKTDEDILLVNEEYAGASALIIGNIDDLSLQQAADLCAYYSKAKHLEQVPIMCYKPLQNPEIVYGNPMNELERERLMIRI